MGNTPVLGLPYPANTDPLANMAAAIQALANAIEAAHPAKWKRGHSSVATDASGDITINHGLGVVPTAVLVSFGRNDISAILAAHTYTSTTFKVRGRVSNTGAIWGTGTSLTVDWLAIA